MTMRHAPCGGMAHLVSTEPGFDLAVSVYAALAR